MTAWECPACGGGFPEPKEDTEDLTDGVRVDVGCPWCDESLDGYPRVVEVEEDDPIEDLRSLGGPSE